jgi:hypothetical protein
MSEKVSVEALGINESGSSYRSSTQVPPLTGAALDEDVELLFVGVPHALNSRISADASDMAIIKIEGTGRLGIMSS